MALFAHSAAATVFANDDHYTNFGKLVQFDVLLNDDYQNTPVRLEIIERSEYAYQWITNNKINFSLGTYFTGTTTFVYELCDAAGQCDRATAYVEVDYQPDFSNDDDPTTPEEPEVPKPSDPIAVDDSFSFTTSLNKTYSLTITDNDSFSDVNTDTVRISNFPMHGVAQLNGNTIDYQPTAGFSGADVLQYELCSAAGVCDLATVTITLTEPEAPDEPELPDNPELPEVPEAPELPELPDENSQPTAVNDFYTLNRKRVMTLNVLSNDDFGADGAANNASKLRILSHPGKKVSIKVVNDAIELRAHPRFRGQVSFLYQICDSNGDCDNAEVRVTRNR